MDTIAELLAALGLDRYASAFVENEIDESLLGDLTDGVLKDIGVAAAGHRIKILRAIAARSPAATAADVVSATSRSPDQAARLADTATKPPAAALAERRNLTVMFCDLVGSTSLAARLDPEDVRDVVRAYQAACAQAIAKFEGFVAQYLGDGIMAYFGYPQAHEDDAERAVRAALDLIAAVAKLELSVTVPVRIGIATGLVVVGDLIGEHAAKERAVTGETPNLAARLQALAAPGSIVVSATTRRLLGGMFELRDLGAQQVKGLNAPVGAFAVEGVRSFESRFEARAGGLTGFVGREDECTHLVERKKLAWQGRGQVVLVTGEAGIGKSRLTAWLAEQITGEPHMRLRYQCTPHHRDSALYPTVVQIERAAGFGAADTPDQKLAKLEAVLALAGLDAAAGVPLFAALLVLPTGERYPPLAVGPAQLRKETIAAMLDQVEGLANRQPLLMLYEDAHWADATSYELLEMLVDRIARLPVLAIVTTRPEFSPPWAGRRNVSTLTLQRLDRRHACAMVESVADGATLPTEVMDQIVAKTDGVPLFVEELTKTVIESGLLIEEGRGYRATGALPAFAIPSTLQDSLMARLDRSNPVKQIAQIGAAIGREFSYKLLVAVAGMDEGAVRNALGKLEEAELASHRGAPPDATYIFKHALVQDAAYESLLKSRRQVIHRRIAKALRDRFPVVAETEPETIAHHLAAAGKTEEAANWWTKAGSLAATRGGFVEAIKHFERAIALADTLPPTPERVRSRLQLQLAYREPVIAIHGWSAQKTTDAFTRASELAAQIDDPEQRWASAYGILHAVWPAGKIKQSMPLAERYLQLAQEVGDATEIMTGHRLVAQLLLYGGDPAGAISEFEVALAAYDYGKHAHLSKLHGADTRTVTLAFLASALWQVGRVDEGRAATDEALAHAWRTKDIPSIGFALGIGCFLEVIRSDFVRLERLGRELLAFSQKNDLIVWVPLAHVYLAHARQAPGELNTSIDQIKQQMCSLDQIQLNLPRPFVTALLSDLETLIDPAVAIATLEAMLAENDQSGNCIFDSALQRRRGQFFSRLSPPNLDAVEAAFRQAISIARTQGARTHELLAALDLARLYKETGRVREARDLLAPTLGGFAETPELPEISEAQSLLASLPT